MGDAGVDVLHPDFALCPGERITLRPAAARAAVRVARLAALRRGPLGHPKPRTLYYLTGARLLLWTGATPADGPLVPCGAGRVAVRGRPPKS